MFPRYIEALLDYLYDYSQRVLPLHDVEGVSLNSTWIFVFTVLFLWHPLHHHWCQGSILASPLKTFQSFTLFLDQCGELERLEGEGLHTIGSGWTGETDPVLAKTPFSRFPHVQAKFTAVVLFWNMLFLSFILTHCCMSVISGAS